MEGDEVWTDIEEQDAGVGGQIRSERLYIDQDIIR